MRLHHPWFRLLLAVLPGLYITAALAEDPTPSAAPAGSQIQYVEITPSFVANYQAPKLRYVRADITVIATNTLAAEAIGRHQPLIRHHLIMLLSRQTEENLVTPEGRSQLKQDAIQEIIKVLESEQESTEVQDLLFTSFIVE